MGYVIKGIRLLIVLAFLVGMPVLALPPVADWCESRIYPPPARREIASAPVKKVSSEPSFSVRSEEPTAIQPASFDDPVESPGGETLGSLLDELHSLGAADYRLDEVAGEPPQFRLVAEFRSEGPLPQRWQYSATDADPQTAVRDVIQQILADRSPQ
jgi:hypothetical protein